MCYMYEYLFLVSLYSWCLSVYMDGSLLCIVDTATDEIVLYMDQCVMGDSMILWMDLYSFCCLSILNLEGQDMLGDWSMHIMTISYLFYPL